MKNETVEQFQAGAAEIFQDDGKVEKLAGGCGFTEGPLWHRNGFLLFSDIPANTIKKMDHEGNLTDYIHKSGFTNADQSMLSEQVGSNGLAYDDQGRILVCQHGNHAIGFIQHGKVETLIPGFANRPFNSPNDIVTRSTGHIYFSDPPYGLKNQVSNAEAFQPSSGVYLFKNGNVERVIEQLQFPNGVCLSPDEHFLFVSSNHPDEPNILKCALDENGGIISTEIFMEQNADGIKTDMEGNLYLATDDGIMVADTAGIIMCILHVPETPANLAWGGKDKNELYITARSSIYRVKTTVKGFMACW